VIVMKFGGSSVASAAAIEWVAGIVKAHIAEQPVIVVSAMGKTTDRLAETLQYAAQGSAYSAWRRLEDLRQYHFQETQRLLGAQAREFLDRRIAPLFRDLHGKLIELEEGRKLTPDLQDEVLSFGECISSEIVAAALEHAGIPTRHVDSREVIVTDDQFTCATPLCWETYAKLRRTVAVWAREQVVVMGGFIGATGEGIATTLGRGGSDLSASLVGAGIAANEIQIWTDVDGMLTCDPRVLHGGYRLRSLRYEEAEELASAGAKVLCPKTVGPAVRQGIPIVIRNSRHPELEGTHIGPKAAQNPGVVKAIACKSGMTIVHLVVPEAGILPAITQGLNDLFERHQVKVEMVQAQPDGVSFAVQSSAQIPELLHSVDQSVRITVEEQSAVITLVGDSITSEPSTLKRALSALLKDTAVRMVSQGGTQRSIRLAVPAEKLTISVENLHREFFRAPDPEIFASTPESSRRLFLARRTAERTLQPNSGWVIQAEPLPSR
jgi:aspartate kinase